MTEVKTDIVLDWAKIKSLYPNEWVLIGNPELGNEQIIDSIIRKFVRGVVLFHTSNRKELAEKGRPFRQGYDTYTVIFTGEIPKGRKFWL